MAALCGWTTKLAKCSRIFQAFLGAQRASSAVVIEQTGLILLAEQRFGCGLKDCLGTLALRRFEAGIAALELGASEALIHADPDRVLVGLTKQVEQSMGANRCRYTRVW